MQTPILAVVIPCYNEEEVLSATLTRLLDVMSDLEKRNVISDRSFIYTVDDGSKDRTFSIIEKFHNKYPEKVRGLSFVKNFGNQKAILAGLLEIKKFEFDCCITIDADLQQDETKIEEFINKFNEGNQLVYGIKNDRNDTSLIKKFCALSFYKLMNLLGAKTYQNHSEFRLVGRKIIDVLAEYKETNIFLRGIFQEMGNSPAIVYYDVKKRAAGASKFSLLDLFSLAIQGITSFSTVPLRLVTFTGLLMSFSAFIVGLSVIIEKLFFPSHFLPGWATTVTVISFIGGVQIFCLGILGEYMGQIYTEVKSRPRYIVNKELK